MDPSAEHRHSNRRRSTSTWPIWAAMYTAPQPEASWTLGSARASSSSCSISKESCSAASNKGLSSEGDLLGTAIKSAMSGDIFVVCTRIVRVCDILLDHSRPMGKLTWRRDEKGRIFLILGSCNVLHGLDSVPFPSLDAHPISPAQGPGSCGSPRL